MGRKDTSVSRYTIIINLGLFILKIIVGIMFNSIAIISDAINSLFDIISSFIIYVSIKVSHQKPDKKHQFGHSRAQPVAGLIVAVFTIILGFQIFIASIERFFSNDTLTLGYLPLMVMVVVLVAKFCLYVYTKIILLKEKSIALEAACVDHRNDIVISIIVLSGLFLANNGFTFFDPIAGVMISNYIIVTGYLLGKENIKYIMGEAPSEEKFKLIEKTTMSVKGVLGFNDVRAHMLGTNVSCEVHIYVADKTSLKKAHYIGNKVKAKLLKIDGFSNVFVHIDPFYPNNLSPKRKFE